MRFILNEALKINVLIYSLLGECSIGGFSFRFKKNAEWWREKF